MESIKAKLRVIGISEFYVSEDSSCKLITYSLGSCLGLTVYDSALRIGGMIHCQLPLSSVDKLKSENKPAMFVDTGVQLLFETMYKLGSKKKDLVVKAAGCSNIMDVNNRFKIGERNFAILRKLMWKNNMLIQAQDIGSDKTRTLSLDIGTGVTSVKINQIEMVLE